jgi:hypothetical protein
MVLDTANQLASFIAANGFATKFVEKAAQFGQVDIDDDLKSAGSYSRVDFGKQQIAYISKP